MPENKHLRFLLVVAYIVIGYFFVMNILPNLIAIFLPFLCALAVALITRPMVVFLKKLKFPNVLATAFSLCIVLALVFGVLYAVVNRVVTELSLLSRQLPSIMASMPATIESIMEKWRDFSAGFNHEFSIIDINAAIEEITASLTSFIMPATQKILNAATGIASSLPHILIFTVTFLFCSVFLVKDYDFIMQSIANQFPEKVMGHMLQVKKYAFSALGKYLKGMAIIMLITFFELFVGFTILNIQYAFLLALIISFLDALPAIGTGGVLVPWSIVSLILGDIRLGVSLLVLYIIILVVRQFIEPKIMSSTLGTYPIITVLGMYAGYRLFGVLGLIGMPILVTIIVYMQRAGLFTIWKTQTPK